jgi:hypothetical protein
VTRRRVGRIHLGLSLRQLKVWRRLTIEQPLREARGSCAAPGGERRRRGARATRTTSRLPTERSSARRSEPIKASFDAPGRHRGQALESGTTWAGVLFRALHRGDAAGAHVGFRFEPPDPARL